MNIITWIPTQYIFTWQLIFKFSSSLNTQFAQLNHELSIHPQSPFHFYLHNSNRPAIIKTESIEISQCLHCLHWAETYHMCITYFPCSGTLPWVFTWLKQTAVLEIVLDNDICDGIKHKLYIVGICRAREMRVDFLCVFPLVQIFELQLNVGRCLFKVIVTCQG